MNKKIIYCLLIGFGFTIISNTSFAEISSEFFYKAAKGKHALNLGHTGGSSRYKIKSSSSGEPQYESYSSFHFEYQYGIHEAAAVYVNLSHADHSIFAINEQATGFGPLQAGVIYTPRVGPGLLYSKLNISSSVFEGEIDPSAPRLKVVDSSFSAWAELGYLWQLSPRRNVGVRLGYGITATDIDVKSSDDLEKKPAGRLSVFTEQTLENSNLWGLALNYHDGEALSSGFAALPTSHEYFRLKDNEDAYNQDSFSAQAYMNIQFSDNLQVLPSFTMAKFVGSKIFSTASIKTFYNLSFRMQL